MSSRIIKDSVSNHPLVAVLSDFAQDQFVRWLLLSDDWGCFNADADVIKGTLYAKRHKVTAKVIESIRSELMDHGFLFCWQAAGNVWGCWVWWDVPNQPFCGITSFNSEGGRNRNRRKTPEPPNQLLTEYICTHGRIMTHLDAVGSISEQMGAIPLPLFPSPVPLNSASQNSSLSRGGAAAPTKAAAGNPEKKPYGEFKHVLLTDDEYSKLKARLNGHTDVYIAELDRWGETQPVKFNKRRNHYATILTWWHRDQGKPGSSPSPRTGGAPGGTHESPAAGRARRTSEAADRVFSRLVETVADKADGSLPKRAN